MKSNLGKLDRIFRFALAVWWLGPWAPQYSVLWINWALFIIGWIALIESFGGWCLLHQIFHVDNRKQ